MVLPYWAVDQVINWKMMVVIYKGKKNGRLWLGGGVYSCQKIVYLTSAKIHPSPIYLPNPSRKKIVFKLS